MQIANPNSKVSKTNNSSIFQPSTSIKKPGQASTIVKSQLSKYLKENNSITTSTSQIQSNLTTDLSNLRQKDKQNSSTRQKKYLSSEKRSTSPVGNIEDFDPSIVKKLMKQIHSLKCQKNQMQEQIIRTSQALSSRVIQNTANSINNTLLRNAVMSDKKNPLSFNSDFHDQELEQIVQTRRIDQDALQPITNNVQEFFSDTIQGPGSAAAGILTFDKKDHYRKNSSLQSLVGGSGKIKKNIEKKQNIPIITTPDSLNQCRQALLISRKHLSSLQEQIQELNEQKSHLDHLFIQSSTKVAKSQEALRVKSDQKSKLQSKLTQMEEQLNAKKESPSYMLQEKRNMIKMKITKSQKLREKLLNEQSQISTAKDQLHQQTEHLLVLRKQMNDRSIQSYLSDSNCFFFEEERQSAQEIALKQRQLTQRQALSQQMVKQIDLLTDEVELLEEQVKDLTIFLQNKIGSGRKQSSSSSSLESKELNIQTPKFIQMYSQQKNKHHKRESRGQIGDDSSIQQALNSDSEFPSGRIKILFDNIAELRSNLQKCSKEYNLLDNEHCSNKIQHQGIQKSLNRLNERLGFLQQDRGETAQRMEDLQLAISKSPISHSSTSLNFSSSQQISIPPQSTARMSSSNIQTPQPYTAGVKHTPGKINRNAQPVQTFSKPIVDCLLHLIDQMSKMREKISQLLHQLPISQETGGYVQTPRTKQLMQAETLLRPLKAPNTTMTKTTVLTIQSAISHLSEMVIDCNIAVSGAIQENNPSSQSGERRFQFTPPNPKYSPAPSRNLNNNFEQKTQRVYNHKNLSKSPMIRNTSRERMVNTSRRQNLPKPVNSRYSSNQSNQRIGAVKRQPAIKIKQNFMSSSSSTASNRKNYRS